MYLSLSALFIIINFWLAKAASLTPDQEATLSQYNKTCLSYSKVKQEKINQIHSGNFTNEPEVQKYFGCMLRSIGIINQKGQLQVDVLKTKVPKSIKKNEAMKIFFACKDKKGANPDETAYVLYKCFWEATPKHIGLDGH